MLSALCDLHCRRAESAFFSCPRHTRSNLWTRKAQSKAHRRVSANTWERQTDLRRHLIRAALRLKPEMLMAATQLPLPRPAPSVACMTQSDPASSSLCPELSQWGPVSTLQTSLGASTVEPCKLLDATQGYPEAAILGQFQRREVPTPFFPVGEDSRILILINKL